MDVRNSVDGLKSLLGVTETASAQAKQGAAATQQTPATLSSDHATLSSAGAEVSQAATDSGVRMDKVTAIQQALATGTYSVSAKEVAGKLVDSMLGSSEDASR